jgi:phosphate starvation-inducible PhoH-like protein
MIMSRGSKQGSGSRGKQSQQFSGQTRAEKRGGRTQKKVVDARWEKNDIQNDGHRVIKDKFQVKNEKQVKPLQAMNDNQKLYMSHLKEKTITICSGSSGSGKTYVACYSAAVSLLRGDIDKIILIRPYEQVGKSIGMRPGTSEEKLTPLMQSMLQPLEEVLGTGEYEYCLKSGKIVMEALEDVRGRSYKNADVIVDEVQSIDVQAIKTLVTRIGEGSKLVLCGDDVPWQQDARGLSGLTWLISTINKLKEDEVDYLDEYDEWELHNNIGLVHFTKDDVVRSGITRMFVKVFDEVG